MALVKCFECGKEISTEAQSCPSCGAPIESAARRDRARPHNVLGGCIAFIVRFIAFIGVLAFLGVLVYISVPSPAPAPAPAPVLPAAELQFCSIVDGATVHYNELSEQLATAHDEKNGILAGRLSQQMTHLRTMRNENLFVFLQQNNFVINTWAATIKSIDGPEGVHSFLNPCNPGVLSCVEIQVQPTCSSVAVVHAWLSASFENLQLLAAKKRGDKLLMTGHIVAAGGGSTKLPSPVLPKSANDVEQSFTESGSMSGPEYSADLTNVTFPP